MQRGRKLARQCLHLIEAPPAGQPDVRERVARRAVAFCHALRVQLRRCSDTQAIRAHAERRGIAIQQLEALGASEPPPLAPADYGPL